MRVVRLHTQQPLAPGSELELEDEIRHYAVNVLRINKRSSLTLFNGDGCDYPCEIIDFHKSILRVKVLAAIPLKTESPLTTHLLLGVSKSSHMDYAIQKSVEAGVSLIQPILSERSVNKATIKSIENKHQHWQRIIQSACEQCGRAKVPELLKISGLYEIEILNENNNEHGLIFDSTANQTMSDLNIDKPNILKLLIGPEGGFSDTEIKSVLEKRFRAVRCGPRIMRTETAAVAAVLNVQSKWGDLGS